jgi:hypothetical protein
MKPDDFEQKLTRQPLRPVPTEWRAEILSAAQAAAPAQPPTLGASKLATFNQQLANFFWPHPKAWAGLSAVWVGIIALNLATRDPAARIAERSSPPSAEVIVELKKQQRMFAELVGPRELLDLERPRIFSPRPRSERVEILVG